jgi:ribonuclease R
MGKKHTTQEAILNILNQQNGSPLNYKQICSRLSIHDSSGRNHITKTLHKLKNKGVVEEQSKGKYFIKPPSYLHQGTLDVNQQGNGYLISDEFSDDVFIDKRHFNKAFHGDTVSFKIMPSKGKRRKQGAVVQIIKRQKTQYVGVVEEFDHGFFVQPKTTNLPFLLSKENIGKAKLGDCVLVSIHDWKPKSNYPQAVVQEILGTPGNHETEIHTIMATHGLPWNFNKEINEYAMQLKTEIGKDEIAVRRDFRDILTFTIDPKDAKDFDDAISFQVLSKDRFEVGIHIADVSHYVEPGSILDKEAYQRATSIYLVDRVVPMLPEKLSNQICSLRPNEEKLTFSAVFEITSTGEVKSEWYGKTVILSKARFAYEEAQHMISSQTKTIPANISLTTTEYTVNDDVFQAIQHLQNIASTRRKNRLKNGAINFNKQEVRFDLDDQNNPKEVLIKESKAANHLIEEFMLLANESVATYIGNRKQAPPFVYRVHDEPNEEKLAQFSRIAFGLGYKLNLNTPNTTAKSINLLLQQIDQKPEKNLLDTLAIRSMSKAIYTTQNIGHYGLYFTHYTHFTSPIRRYPDVIIHRLLQHYLTQKTLPKTDDLEQQLKHCTDQEILATKAERDSIKFMQVKYISKYIGSTKKGSISGLTERGVFIELEESKCEGFVRIQDLPDDYYYYDAAQLKMIGQKTKKEYQLGDPIHVLIVATDLIKRQIDLSIVDD